MHQNILPQTCTHCEELSNRIRALSWNRELGMLNRAGLDEQIERLPRAYYTVVFCDIDHLKRLNSATGSHVQTNRYLKEGLQVRAGEIAGQLYGDEIVFILRPDTAAPLFVYRIRKQLAGQPLTTEERRALILSGGDGRLSATFAYREQVTDIWRAIEECSVDVLAQKAGRP